MRPPCSLEITADPTHRPNLFLSRSSLSFGIPPLPRRYLPVPAVVQFFVLSLLILQSSNFIFSPPAFTPPAIPPAQGIDRTITFVFLLICLEGLCAGSSYVNTFYHVGREGDEADGGSEDLRTRMEKEFRIGSVGASDSFGELSTCPREPRYTSNQVSCSLHSSRCH